jgi:hypothetical protein
LPQKKKLKNKKFKKNLGWTKQSLSKSSHKENPPPKKTQKNLFKKNKPHPPFP